MSAALANQHAMHMRRIILSSVASLDLPYFSILSYKRHDFRGGGEINEHKIFYDFLHNFCLNVPHSKKNSAIFHQKFA